jgi:hypothetical protein
VASVDDDDDDERVEEDAKAAAGFVTAAAGLTGMGDSSGFGSGFPGGEKANVGAARWPAADAADSRRPSTSVGSRNVNSRPSGPPFVVAKVAEVLAGAADSCRGEAKGAAADPVPPKALKGVGVEAGVRPAAPEAALTASGGDDAA